MGNIDCPSNWGAGACSGGRNGAPLATVPAHRQRTASPAKEHRLACGGRASRPGTDHGLSLQVAVLKQSQALLQRVVPNGDDDLQRRQGESTSLLKLALLPGPRHQTRRRCQRIPFLQPFHANRATAYSPTPSPRSSANHAAVHQLTQQIPGRRWLFHRASRLKGELPPPGHGWCGHRPHRRTRKGPPFSWRPAEGKEAPPGCHRGKPLERGRERQRVPLRDREGAWGPAFVSPVRARAQVIARHMAKATEEVSCATQAK